MRKYLLIFILFLTGCNSNFTEIPPFVNCTEVTLADISDEKVFQGYIDMGLDVNLSFGLAGIINGIFVREGDFVKKGQFLAKLDNDEYKYSIERAKSELEDAKVKYNRAKSYFERISKLHAAGGISYNDWEGAQTDLKSAYNQIEILKDALKIARNKETFSNIYAPYDGYIIKIYPDKMQFVAAGQKIFYFRGKGQNEARIFASQNDIGKIGIGQKVVLKADAIPDKEYNGAIKSFVGSSIDEGSFRVTISIEGENKELYDGMSINARIFGKKKSGIFIPVNSVQDDFVFILDKKTSTVAKRKVQTGRIYNGQIEIKNGLNAGEFIVTDGISKLKDKDKVRYEN